MSLAKRFVGNVLGGYVAYGLMMATNFALVPFLLDTLGKARYGLWSLVFAIGQMSVLLDMGMLGAIRRFQSEAMASSDSARSNEVLGVTLTIYATLGALAAGVVLSGIWWLPLFAEVPTDLRGEMVVALIGAAVFIATTFLRSPFVGVLFGRNRIDLDRIVTSIQRVLYACVAAVLVLTWRRTLDVLTVSMVSTALLWLISTVLLAKREHSAMRLGFRGPSSPVFRPLISFSALAMLSTVAVVLQQQGPKLIIGNVCDVDAVAETQVLLVLGSMVLAMLRVLSLPLFPVASRLDQARLKDLYVRGSSLCVLLGLCMVLPLTFLSPEVLGQWAGPSFVRLWPVLVMILAAALLHASQVPAIHIITARKGVARISVIVLTESVTLLVALWILAGPVGLGVAAVGIAFIGAHVVWSGVVIPIYACGELGLPPMRYYRRALRRPAAVGAAMVWFCLFARVAVRPPSLVWTVVELLVLGAISLVISLAFGFDREDIQRLRGALRRGKRTGDESPPSVTGR